ncbi:MAG: FHA domain-containing protein [Actinomycetia bacterium]|nr:FHA domain-containing protein [Actinomycetes bacterium]
MPKTCPEGHLSTSEDYCDTCGLAIADDASSSVGAADSGAAGGSATQECPNCSAQNPGDALFCEACGYDYTTGTMPRPVEPMPFPMPGQPAPEPAVDGGGAADDEGDEGSGEPAADGDAAGESLLTLPEDEPASSSAADAAGDADDAAEDGAGPADPDPLAAPDPGAGAVPDPGASPTDGPVDHSPAPLLDEPWVAEVWIDPDWYADQGSADPMPSPGLPAVAVLRHSSSLIGRSSRSRGIDPELDISGDPGVSRRHAQVSTDGSRWFIEDLGSANGTYVAAATAGLPNVPIPAGQRRELAAGEQIYLGAWTRIVIRRAADGEA